MPQNLQFIPVVLSFLALLVSVFGHALQNTAFNLQAREDTGRPPRLVWLIIDTFATEAGPGHHSEIQVEGIPPEDRLPDRADKDGAMRFGFRINGADEAQLCVTEFDEAFGKHTIGKKSNFVDGLGRKINPLGYIYSTNDELFQMNPTKSGKGIIHDAYKLSPGYIPGDRDCNAFARRLVQQLGLSQPKIEHWFDKVATYMKGITVVEDPLESVVIQYSLKKINVQGDAENHFWILEDADDPKLIPELSTPQEKIPDERLYLPNIQPQQDDVAGGSDTPETDPDKKIQATFEGDIGCPAPKRVKSEWLLRREVLKCNPKVLGPKEYGYSRFAGQLSLTAMTDDGVLKTAGFDDVAKAAARSYVLVDIANTASKFAGLAFKVIPAILGALLADPVSLVFALVIDTLISIILLIVEGDNTAHVNEQDPVAGAQAILQRQFFGKPDKTGNEECIKQGNHDCSLLLGSTTLSAGLNLTNAEAAALLIHFNNGMPMALPDLAKNLVVGYHDHPLPADAIFGVMCQPAFTTGAKTGFILSDRLACNNPKYSLNAELIPLPNLNMTAAEVFASLVGPGAPADADCKLINDAASTITIGLPDDSNIVVHGSPVAFQKGVKDGDPDGTDPRSITGKPPSSLINPYPDGMPGQSVSGGTISTDLAPHVGDAPPVHDFGSIETLSALCLADDVGKYVCFPNGTYNPWRDPAFTGVDLTKIVGISQQPEVPNSNISFTYEDRRGSNLAGAAAAKADLHRVAQLKPNKQLTEDEHNALSQAVSTGQQLHANIPDTKIPCYCQWTEKDFKGSMICIGEGGGPLQDQYANKAKSIAVKNAKVVLYDLQYNDKSGVDVQGEIADLGKENYGNGTWLDTISAVWIREDGEAGI